MLSERVKTVMRELRLTQVALAVALGVNLQRVKNLTAGNVQKLHQEEMRAFVEKLRVRADYLATGELPVLIPKGEQEFDRRVALLREAARGTESLGLDPAYSEGIRDLIYSTALQDQEMALRAIGLLSTAHAALNSTKPRKK